MRRNKILETVKKHRVIVSVITLILVLLIMGTTLAIYLISGEGKDKNYTLANINVKYIDGDTIKAENAIPLADYEIEEYAAKKEFNFKNTGSETLYAEILLTEIEMDESLKSKDFKWELYEEDNKISSGSFVNVKDTKRLSLKRGIRVDVEAESKKYKILVYIADNGKDQNTMEETSMSAKVKVVATDKPTLYEDNSGANPPKLADGMIPVIYDEESDAWVKADLYNKWYDYDEQMWANAVTVATNASNCGSNCIDNVEKNNREYYLNAEAGTPISMDDINSMWVWIPRYKYKIPSSLGIANSTPPEIDVVFEKGLQATGVSEKVYREGIKSNGTNENYYTHPAFRDGTNIYNTEEYDIGGWDAELTGIWVGKFETGGTANYPLIKPNITSLAYQNIDKQFATSLIMTNGNYNQNTGSVIFNINENNLYGLNTTKNNSISRMMKNTEWGMVAYLSQSKYGKMGNSDYVGLQKEVYVNNTNITGKGSGLPTQNKNESYYYNDMKDLKTKEKSKGIGTGASTTGTIYGIYDMNGANSEILLSKAYSSGIFTNFPEPKYYDDYKDKRSIGKDTVILGDATWETFNWYDDSTNFPSYYPDRGGDAFQYPGLFCLRTWSGTLDASAAFRIVLNP